MLGILFFAKALFQRYRNSCLVVPSYSQIHVCVYVYDPPLLPNLPILTLQDTVHTKYNLDFLDFQELLSLLLIDS